MYAAAAAAQCLDPRGPLTAAVDAARASINTYHVTLRKVGRTEETPAATVEALNDFFTTGVGHLSELMQAHRVAAPT